MIKKIDIIHLASTDQCTGCAACFSVCPTNSITMKLDREGFLQPYIDTDTCISCHKCEKTCPIISPVDIPTDFETQAFAAINKDEVVRMRSSSGGMFHALAKWTIEQGGVVFGARFDENWDLVHDYTETLEGIEPFMRSKYVQSRIGETYKQAREFLKAGRKVLFTGTPCQIGGLHAFLGKDYDNLISVDIICHGVPSPGVWRKYLRDKVRGDTVKDINFRDKFDGWKDFQCVTITTTGATTTRERQRENIYMRGFLDNIYLRKSCYNCQYKQKHRKSDFTLADAWGIQNYAQELNDNKGTSVIFIHSKKGINIQKYLESDIRYKSLQAEQAIYYNPSMISNAKKPQLRRTLFFVYLNILGFHTARYYIDKDPVIVRATRKIRKIFKK